MINKRGAVLPFFLLTLGFSLIATRLFFIQIWEHDKLVRKVDSISMREGLEEPLRGTIFDRTGRVLAMSVKTYTFFADPQVCEDLKKIAAKLKKIGINLDADAIAWNKNTSYVPLIKELHSATKKKIEKLEIKGTGFITEYVRQYPEASLACHLIGVVGIDGKGLSGIEYSKNNMLQGNTHEVRFYRDGRGKKISEKYVNSENMQGADVYLTIDRNLQFIAEKELDDACKELKPKKAIVIIQNPNNGEILAMASRPNFDPQTFSSSKGVLKNIAVTDIFEPGSTFKIVAMTGILEEGIVKSDEKIFCENGKYKVFDHIIKDHEKKGNLSLNEIMEYSSNIGMSKLAARLGKEKLFRYVRQFGFGAKTGVDLPGESKGLLRSPENWSGLSMSVLSFGQEIGVTAMQVINSYSAVANGGKLLEPKIIINKDIPENKTAGNVRMIRQIASPETISRLKAMLVSVVENGTGMNAKIHGYTVGGKTGTAQKRDPKTGLYSDSGFIASFCGIIPVSSPKLTILVVIDEPKDDHWGASTAAPVFRKIASQAVRYLKILPDTEMKYANNKPNKN